MNTSELFQTLSPRQRRAVLALLTCPTTEEAARSAHVGRTTLYGWLKDPLFAMALEEKRTVQMEETLAYLQSNLLKAVRKLSALLDSQSEAIAHKAAVSLLEFGLKALELGDLTQRLQRLEEGAKNGLEAAGFPPRTISRLLAS